MSDRNQTNNLLCDAMNVAIGMIAGAAIIKAAIWLKNKYNSQKNVDTEDCPEWAAYAVVSKTMDATVDTITDTTATDDTTAATTDITTDEMAAATDETAATEATDEMAALYGEYLELP